MRFPVLIALLPGLAFAGPEPNAALVSDLDEGDEIVELDVELVRDLTPPAPLSGVPIEFRCEGAPPEGHSVYRRYPGRDLHQLVRGDESVELDEDLLPRDAIDVSILQPWLDRNVCTLIWEQIAAAGAHAAPADVKLPARAVLDVRLSELFLEGSREVEQRVGSTVMPISVPHWALSLSFAVAFSIEYTGAEDAVKAAPLQVVPRGGAEQDDYTPLRMGALLRAATLAAFEGLPDLLADEGRLGDLLFAVVDRPTSAPPALGVSGVLSDSFWLLLSPAARARHDAMAFYLSSKAVNRDAQKEMARWFLLHDSDLGLRRDALAWLMNQEAPADAELSLSDSMTELMLWLLSRDPSPRIRAEVVHILNRRTGPEIRDLLLVASGDEDARVSEVAITLLGRFPPATAAELDRLELVPRPPRLAPWTVAFDGRLPPPPGTLDEHLLSLATAAGGPASETFTVQWLRGTTVRDQDLDWVSDLWLRLSANPSPRVRGEAIGRLGREEGRGGADEILAARIATESTWALRLQAVEALHDPNATAGAEEALLAATHDGQGKVRAAAARRLAEIPGADTDRRLEVLMRNDVDPKVRRAAKKALRQRQMARN